MEWKNIPDTQYLERDYGREAGRNWGFNLDGSGDYLAMTHSVHPDTYTTYNTNPWGRCDPGWQTMFVENGTKMDRFDSGATFGANVNGSNLIEISLSSSVSANYYAGCFFVLESTNAVSVPPILGWLLVELISGKRSFTGS
jgi:hypothetical protein